MRRLNRTQIAVPACLATYSHSRNCWDDVSSADKADIRAHLEQMQGRRCAYCEGPLDVLGQHIEHFRRRRHYPHLAFEWRNLYWSCDQADSCGHFKDSEAGTYNPDDLIDPCIEDPDRFFRFHSDGTISIRKGLSPSDQHRAQETLRVFNLNPNWGRLRNMRKVALSPYVSLATGAAGFSVQELQEYFNDELAKLLTSPFYTAIRHVLTEP